MCWRSRKTSLPMPLQRQQASYPEQGRASLKTASAKQYVLVVDDDAACRREVLDLLGAAGIAAMGTGDGTEALAQVRLRRPSVIVLDLSAPRLGHVHLARILRADARLGQIPTISISDSAEDLGGAPGQGPVLCKPMDSRYLLRLVRSYLGG